MKRFSAALAAVAMVTAGLLLTTPRPADSETVQLVVVDVKAVASGYRASKLIGSAVENDKKEKIGTLDDVVITKDRALFAVLQVGGFLGIGGHLIAIPFDSLVLNDPSGKIILPGASKEEVKKLAEFKYGV